MKTINFIQNYILKLCFFRVILQTQKGKGDYNVQVKTKLKVNQKVLQEKDKGGSNVQVKTLVQS